jgi:hypothetical protein
LLTGRLELEWVLPRPPGLQSWLPWAAREQRLWLLRFSLADTLLQHETLSSWAERVVSRADKRVTLGEWREENMARGHDSICAGGVPRDFRRRFWRWVGNRIGEFWPLWSDPTPPRGCVWHCEPSNKIFMLGHQVAGANAHVVTDMLDSLECH